MVALNRRKRNIQSFIDVVFIFKTDITGDGFPTDRETQAHANIDRDRTQDIPRKVKAMDGVLWQQ
ncbi:hypothetical protein DPMN_124140 [Dreissena polymorpha]|uniref:Uncharacterized protein n=1 Tax=Dreissena polymorpha TaxID=45954 RepID=A0A9D4GYX0_DREPO|nr:hypothetical protein DPMN_124140 [Dreissena polymorpha]